VDRQPAEGDDATVSTSIQRRRDALLWRIHRRFPTVTANQRFGSIEFPFTRVADPDRVLDEVAEEEDRREKLGGVRIEEPLHLPYWAELWDSAAGIAQHLAAGHTIVDGKDVLDLGCGQGLAGCAAAALGAHVLFADLEAPALLFAALNSLPFVDRVRTHRLNWQRDRLDESFDVVLGADILYERAQWPFLEPFWRAHLRSGGNLLLAEPGRQTGDIFVEWIASHGWWMERFEERVPTRDVPIRIFRLAPR
jgi:predicted nicotinamide N-methyase